jgi:predicted TIM-barrel fold metal-dependent hydrolase
MIIDAHYHLEERMQPLAQLLARMDKQNIQRIALIATVCDPLPWDTVTKGASVILRALLTSRLRGAGMKLYTDLVTVDGNFNVLGKHYGIYNMPDNSSVARAMQVHPDRFYGWIFVNPSASDPFAELGKWATRPGWIGVKSHPFFHRYPVKLLDAVAGYCAENNLLLLVHLGSDAERGDFRYLPDRHPKLKIVYAHAGLPFYREVWEYGRDHPNVFVDLSSDSYVNQRLRLAAIRALGARRCLAGTDGPYCNADHGKTVRQILRLPITDAEKECVLGGNFQSLITDRAVVATD